jgi:nitrate/nitrite transporter NarK
VGRDTTGDTTCATTGVGCGDAFRLCSIRRTARIGWRRGRAGLCGIIGAFGWAEWVCSWIDLIIENGM